MYQFGHIFIPKEFIHPYGDGEFTDSSLRIVRPIASARSWARNDA